MNSRITKELKQIIKNLFKLAGVDIQAAVQELPSLRYHDLAIAGSGYGTRLRIVIFTYRIPEEYPEQDTWFVADAGTESDAAAGQTPAKTRYASLQIGRRRLSGFEIFCSK